MFNKCKKNAGNSHPAILQNNSRRRTRHKPGTEYNHLLQTTTGEQPFIVRQKSVCNFMLTIKLGCSCSRFFVGDGGKKSQLDFPLSWELVKSIFSNFCGWGNHFFKFNY